MTQLSKSGNKFRAGVIKEIPVLFTDTKFDRQYLPEGFYAYDIRHKFEGRQEPATIEKFVLVHFYGTIITKQPLDIPKQGFIELGEDDWSFYDTYKEDLEPGDWRKEYVNE